MRQIAEALRQIKADGLFREFKWLEAPQGPSTVIEGQKVLLLSSNSYLGLCNDERLKKAAINAIEKFGVGSGGSRLTSGSYRLHQQLEMELAQFKHTEACLVFNTGYMANLGTIAGLADKEWVIFCDRLNHASIIDGCRLSGDVALEALAIIRSDPGRRERLLSNALWFRRELTAAGFNVPEGFTPIIPVLIGPADTAVQFSNRLLEEGIYIPAIRPPTVHQGTSRLRISLMATHSRETLHEAVNKIKIIGRELQLIK